MSAWLSTFCFMQTYPHFKFGFQPASYMSLLVALVYLRTGFRLEIVTRVRQRQAGRLDFLVVRNGVLC